MKRIKALYAAHPILGLRTIKTVMAVILVSLFMQYVFHQTPFFACIGAVAAMEKTISSSVRAAAIRNIGTIVGGCVGIAVASFTENIFVMALGLIPFILISNLIGEKASIVPGAIVYFAVFYLNSMSEAWIYGLTRIAGTLFGSIIAIAVNVFIFPPKAQEIPNVIPMDSPSEQACLSAAPAQNSMNAE